MAPYMAASPATSRPREHAWRSLMSAIFYLTRSGVAQLVKADEANVPLGVGLPGVARIAAGRFRGLTQMSKEKA